MKPNNRDCKIVQDLLPNYLENLTDTVTNEYIEEHIATCAECAQVLKDMNGDLKLEQIHQEPEIKYLKGIRRRVRRTILAVTIAIILIAGCVIGYVYKKSQIQVNNYTFLRASYVANDEEATKDGKVYGIMMAVFDEKDICISVRVVEKGYMENEIQMRKKIAERNEETFPVNVKIENEEIHYNVNIWNGLKRQEVEKMWTQYYKEIQIETI